MKTGILAYFMQCARKTITSYSTHSYLDLLERFIQEEQINLVAFLLFLQYLKKLQQNAIKIALKAEIFIHHLE